MSFQSFDVLSVLFGAAPSEDYTQQFRKRTNSPVAVTAVSLGIAFSTSFPLHHLICTWFTSSIFFIASLVSLTHVSCASFPHGGTSKMLRSLPAGRCSDQQEPVRSGERHQGANVWGERARAVPR